MSHMLLKGYKEIISMFDTAQCLDVWYTDNQRLTSSKGLTALLVLSWGARLRGCNITICTTCCTAQQQTQEQRKVSLIKRVSIVRKHREVITTFQGSEDKQRFITKNRLPRVLNASSRDDVMHIYTAFSFPLNVQRAHSTI
jgi:hypothetical protein